MHRSHHVPQKTAFTCMEFSCRLRYRVLIDMLSGTCSRFCLVQMTRLAWLEQVQREGQGEAAPASSGPGGRSRSSSWASRKRKGEGPGRQVSVAMRMATGTWPCSLTRGYSWGGSTPVDLRENNCFISLRPARGNLFFLILHPLKSSVSSVDCYSCFLNREVRR